jgi:hypothetical protein
VEVNPQSSSSKSWKAGPNVQTTLVNLSKVAIEVTITESRWQKLITENNKSLVKSYISYLITGESNEDSEYVVEQKDSKI